MNSSYSLEASLKAPVWDPEFWDAMVGVQDEAKKALMSFWEQAMEGDGCSCDTCIVSLVLEALWPVLTEQVTLVVERAANPTSLSCNGPCKNGKPCQKACDAEA